MSIETLTPPESAPTATTWPAALISPAPETAYRLSFPLQLKEDQIIPAWILDFLNKQRLIDGELELLSTFDWTGTTSTLTEAQAATLHYQPGRGPSWDQLGKIMDTAVTHGSQIATTITVKADGNQITVTLTALHLADPTEGQVQVITEITDATPSPHPQLDVPGWGAPQIITGWDYR